MSHDHNLTSDTTKLAAQCSPDFKFCGPAEITGSNSKLLVDLIMSNAIDSAGRLTETVGKSITAGAAAGLMSQNPVIGLAVGGAVAFHNVVSGGKTRG